MNGHWVLKYYYAGGKPLATLEGPYVEGKRHGQWIEGPDVQNKSKGRYVNGKQVGTWLTYNGRDSKDGSCYAYFHSDDGKYLNSMKTIARRG